MMKVTCCLLLLTSVQAFQAPTSLLVISSCKTTSVLKAAPPSKKSTIDYDYEYAQETSTSSTSPSTSPFSTFSMEDLKNFKLPENMKMPNNIQMPDLSNVMATFSEGEFGSRGEIYLAAQAVLVLAIVFGGNHLPFLDTALFLTGPALFLGGLTTVVLSVSDLGDALSPFTVPTARGSLKTDGVYSYVRHPMYTGLLATMAGFALISDSATRLLLTAVLFAVLNVKSEMEEVELQNMYPGEFAQYQQTVTGKFFPNEWWEQVKPGAGGNDNGSGKLSP